MCAQFILRYAGAAVRLTDLGMEFVEESQADKYVAEADAWWAAFRAGLNQDHCAVVNYYAEQRQAANLN